MGQVRVALGLQLIISDNMGSTLGWVIFHNQRR
ncbi:hypothetical protein HacjB3_07275 [Halalkalicoccus jeotgali B3]|uniref:Uncharacterized protein n=1 Tax=Halalkalicoccus jeotgali (strain DSM 18796 / CECT 7217 / JCM 14584 / KCTC 4019 / B3) TaxID=795797 RepID=D8JAW8_HALJB|nr:hypothetical protein HacjB3_07275 [Halalkalicoccus jeotgali B3]